MDQQTGVAAKVVVEVMVIQIQIQDDHVRDPLITRMGARAAVTEKVIVIDPKAETENEKVIDPKVENHVRDPSITRMGARVAATEKVIVIDPRAENEDSIDPKVVVIIDPRAEKNEVQVTDPKVENEIYPLKYTRQLPFKSIAILRIIINSSNNSNHNNTSSHRIIPIIH